MAFHRITNVDESLKIADCSECGPAVPVRINLRSGRKSWWRCLAKYTSVKNRIERPWTSHKKDYCEWPDGCSFVIVHPCQLAVDHIDGNKANNSPENLQTLCHNHHSLKTHLNNDYTRSV